MDTLGVSLNKLFIQQLTQKLLFPHQSHFTAEVSIMDYHINELGQNVPLKIWDIYGNRVPIVVGYVTHKAQ